MSHQAATAAAADCDRAEVGRQIYNREREYNLLAAQTRTVDDNFRHSISMPVIGAAAIHSF